MNTFIERILHSNMSSLYSLKHPNMSTAKSASDNAAKFMANRYELLFLLYTLSITKNDRMLPTMPNTNIIGYTYLTMFNLIKLDWNLFISSFGFSHTTFKFSNKLLIRNWVSFSPTKVLLPVSNEKKIFFSFFILFWV